MHLSDILDIPFCHRNMHVCAHFCYKMVHCGACWGRMTHICASKLTVIGSDNGSNIFIQENPFEYFAWKMASILSRLQCGYALWDLWDGFMSSTRTCWCIYVYQDIHSKYSGPLCSTVYYKEILHTAWQYVLSMSRTLNAQSALHISTSWRKVVL